MISFNQNKLLVNDKILGAFYMGFFRCNGCGNKTSIIEVDFGTHCIDLCSTCFRNIGNLVDQQENMVEDIILRKDPRTFLLVRSEDVSGVSGIGTVAEGIEFTDGTVVLRWLSENSSTVIWDNLESAMKVHGHDGKTIVKWLEE